MYSLRIHASACVCAAISSLFAMPSVAAGALAAPANVTAIPGIGQVTLQWSTVGGADSYNIYYETVSVGSNAKPKVVGVQTDHVTVTGLRSPQNYFFKVKAVSGEDVGAASAELQVLTDAAAFKPETVQAFFHTGASLLNPYKLKTDTTGTTIEAATRTDVNPFLEFIYANRLAWNGRKIEEFLQGDDDLSKLDWPGKNWEVEARIGYTFAGGSDTTANTIVGSGDFNAELAAGLPFFLKQAASRKYNFSYGFEFGYSAVTERGALKAHDSLFGGLSYNASFEDPFGSLDKAGNARHGLLNFRMLYATVDSVRYTPADDVPAQIETREGFPKYHQKWTLSFQSELLFPLYEASYLTFSGRVYPNMSPGLWSMQVGFTVAPTKLLKSLALE